MPNNNLVPDPLRALLRAYTKYSILTDFVNTQDSQAGSRRWKTATDAQSEPECVKLFTTLCTQAMNSRPYRIGTGTLDYIWQLNEDEVDSCLRDVAPPFPFTWFNIESADGISRAGVLLRTNETKRLFATVCLVHGKIIQPEVPELFSPSAEKKLMALKDTYPIDVYLNMEFDGPGLMFKRPTKAFTCWETQDYCPIIKPDPEITAHEFEEGLRDFVRPFASVAVLVSGAITKKSQFFPTVMRGPGPPSPGSIKFSIKRGIAPEIEAPDILVDITKIPVRTDNPSPKTRKEPDFQQIIPFYEYLRAGKFIKVPSHRHWTKKPEPPNIQQHLIRAQNRAKPG